MVYSSQSRDETPAFFFTNLFSRKLPIRAISRMLVKSVSKSSFRLRRCTFTATGAPPSVARCTWPSEAPATGVSSNVSNTSPSGLPSSSSTSSATRSGEIVGTLSCSATSASMYGCASRSVRADATCPSLIIVGPSRSSSSRSHCAHRTCFSSFRPARQIFHVAIVENHHSAIDRRSGRPRDLSQRSSIALPESAVASTDDSFATIVGVGGRAGTTTPAAKSALVPTVTSSAIAAPSAASICDARLGTRSCAADGATRSAGAAARRQSIEKRRGEVPDARV